jgi:hypothetical protein
VIAAGATDEFEDDVAIAGSGAYADHHRTAVLYFAAGTNAGPEAPR